MNTDQKIIDGDGHVVEDIATIWKYMPQEYVGKSFSDMRGRSPFPPIDHLHTANRHFTPKGAFANVGREGWELFLQEVGIGTTVLYTSAGLAFGKIVSRDWPIYGEAERLGCAIAIHGGVHEGMLMDDLSPYAPVNALGHPMSQMICFAGIIFNGIFDRFPGVRIGFMEAGSAWL